jgi:hypothetical protein
MHNFLLYNLAVHALAEVYTAMHAYIAFLSHYLMQQEVEMHSEDNFFFEATTE